MSRHGASILVPAAALVAVVAPLATAAPVLSGASLTPTTWTQAVDASAGWTQSGMEGEVSPSVRVEVNAAEDGTATGPWLTVHTDVLSAISGARAATFDTTALSGRHFARVVVRTPAGLVASMPLGTLQIDRSPPVIRSVGATHTPQASALRWTEDDPLSGLDASAPHLLEVNSSSAGDAAGTWLPVAVLPATGTDGLASAEVAGAILPRGTHLARVTATDRAGNASTTQVGVVYSDREAPVVSALRIVSPPTAGSDAAEIAFDVADPAPGSGVGPGSPARVTDASGATVLWEGSLDHLTGQQVRFHVSAAGYRIVVAVTDRAGNVGTSAPLTVAASAGGAIPATGAGSPARRPHGPRATVRVSVSRTTLRFGSGLRITGRVVSGSRALAGADVEVSDGAGFLAEAVTDGHGRFALRCVPRTSGRLGVSVVDRAGRVRPVTMHGARPLTVRPLVTWKASATALRAGGAPLVVTGRIGPAPRLLPGRPTKRVVLEWRDPLRGSWRPVVDGQAGSDGRFRLTWRFAAGGFSVPMRVRVPEELGWPLAGTVTAPVTVTVRR